MGILEIAKDAPATAADALVGRFTGVRTKSFSPVATLRASGKGLLEGIAEGRGVMKHGMDKEALQKLEVRETRFANQWFDKYQKTIFRSLSAADKPFKRAAFNRSFSEQLRLGRSEAEAAKIAAEDAAEAVFQNDSRLGKALAGIKEPFGAAGDIVVPFVRTPGAIAGKTVEYSVGALATPNDLARVWRAAANGDERALLAAQKKLVERFGRNATGALALALGYELAHRGLMTGSSPESKSEREQQGLEGKMPGSILIGGRWYGVSSIAPLANVMILGADFYHRSQDPELTLMDAGKAAIAGVGRQTVDLSSMRGVQDVLGVVKSPAQAGRYLRNTAASFVPTGVAQAARMLDDKVREPKSLLQSVMTRVPIASRSVPSRIDQLGREVERDKVSRATSLIDPFATRAAQRDELVKEMERVGVSISRPTKRSEESDSEYRARSLAVGSEVRAALTRVIASAHYKRSGKQEQAKLLSDETRSTRASYTRRQRKGLSRRASLTQAGLRMLEQ